MGIMVAEEMILVTLAPHRTSMNSPTRSTNYDATGTENGDTLKCRACGERHADPSDTTIRRPSCGLYHLQQGNAVSLTVEGWGGHS